MRGLVAATSLACCLSPAVAIAQEASGTDASWRATPENAAGGLPAESWAGVSTGWDVRLEGDALFKHYTRSDGRGLWQAGPAGGLEASASLHFRMPASTDRDGRAGWLDFELGVTSAMRYAGWRDGLGHSTSFFEDDTGVVVAAHLAFGRAVSGVTHAVWSGFVAGVAWVPTWSFFFGSPDFPAADRMNPAGLRVTLDVGRVAQRGRVCRPMFRVSLTWLPYVNDAPSAISTGLGVAFY